MMSQQRGYANDAEGPELARALQKRHVSMIALGGIIGAGLFVGSSAAIAEIGPAVSISYVLAGLIVLLVMWMLSEMLVANPRTRVFTDCIRDGLGPWAGFVSGWLYWFSWMMIVAIEAIIAADMLHAWSGIPVWLIGFLLMGLLTAANLFSARAFGELEFWFSSIKVAAIVTFIGVGGAFALGWLSMPGGGEAIGNLLGHGGFAPSGLGAVLAGVVTVIFSLLGSEIAAVAAAESEDGSAAVARLTRSLALRVMLFYVGSMTVICAVTPWTSIVPGQSPFVTALSAMRIPAADMVMSVIVLTAVLSCLNSGIYAASRILFSLAGHGDAPARLVALNRRQVPAHSIYMGGLFGVCGILVSQISPNGVFVFLVNSVGALALIIYLMVVAAHIRSRRRLGAEGAARLSVRVWLFPGLSYAVGGAILAILVGMAFNPKRAPELYCSLISVGVVVTACGVSRAVKQRRRGAASAGTA